MTWLLVPLLVMNPPLGLAAVDPATWSVSEDGRTIEFREPRTDNIHEPTGAERATIRASCPLTRERTDFSGVAWSVPLEQLEQGSTDDGLQSLTFRVVGWQGVPPSIRVAGEFHSLPAEQSSDGESEFKSRESSSEKGIGSKHPDFPAVIWHDADGTVVAGLVVSVPLEVRPTEDGIEILCRAPAGSTAAIRGQWFHQAGSTRQAWLAAAVAWFLQDREGRDPTAREVEFAAHNAYPFRTFYCSRCFERARESGLRHIEVDITYDATRDAAVVTHDARPVGGEPELGTFLQPLWDFWRESDDSGFTLILDFKSSDRSLAEAVSRVLQKEQAILSKMKNDGRDAFQSGKVTVCLTGSTVGHERYRELVGEDGWLLAFGDRSSSWKSNPAEMVPEKPAGFVRYLTYNHVVFQEQKGGKGWDTFSRERLATVARLARERGYRVRIYTINVLPRSPGAANPLPWWIAAEAGIHMIATDDYEFGQEWRANWLAAKPFRMEE